jgi:hypothetical protein
MKDSIDPILAAAINFAVSGGFLAMGIAQLIRFFKQP